MLKYILLFSYYLIPDFSPKYQNGLDLPKLEAFLAAPSLWLVSILLCTLTSSLARISKDEQYWANTRKSVASKLKSMRKKGNEQILGEEKKRRHSGYKTRFTKRTF